MGDGQLSAWTTSLEAPQWQDGEGVVTSAMATFGRATVTLRLLFTLRTCHKVVGAKAFTPNEEAITSDRYLDCGVVLGDLVSPTVISSKCLEQYCNIPSIQAATHTPTGAEAIVSPNRSSQLSRPF